MSLRVRMGLAAGLAVAVAVFAVSTAAYFGTRSQLLSQVDQSLTRLADEYVTASHANGPGGGNQGQPGGGFFNLDGSGQAQSNGGSQGGVGDCDDGLGINAPPGVAFGGATGFVQLLRPNGAVCRGTGETSELPVSRDAMGIATSGQGQFFTTLTVHGDHIRVLVAGLGADGALMLAWPLGDVDSSLHSLLLLLAIVAASGIALAGLLGFLVARTAVAPIARFTRRTELIALSPERLSSQRLEVVGDDELARLARTFNATLDELEESIAAQRNLVADASHELRTPIATLRANLQLLRDEQLLPAEDREALRRDMIDELDELTSLVSDVVELARGTKATADPGELSLDRIVSEAIDRARRRAPGLGFVAELQPAVIRGDGERVARAVTNLLDNASKWSPDGGRVEVGLTDGVLTVRDHGPGFQEEDLPFVFDRFHRAREARSKPGSGLGLAIVRQAAEAHGGFAEATNAADGGALLRVSFGPALELAPAERATMASI